MAYIMMYGKPVFIEEIYKVESDFLRCFYTYNGVIPVKIKSRSLELALDFCKARATTKNAFAQDFNRFRLHQELNLVNSWILHQMKEKHVDAIDLIHAAGMLQIQSLFNLLFEDVVGIICAKTPEEVEKIFKVHYNGDHRRLSWINYVLKYAPSCPDLSKVEEEEMKLNRQEILKVSPADFKYLPDPQKRYWVFAHLVIKRNPSVFVAAKQLSAEEAAEDEEEEEEEESKQEAAAEDSKVPKNDDDVGGSGPRGVAWTRRQQFDA